MYDTKLSRSNNKALPYQLRQHASRMPRAYYVSERSINIQQTVKRDITLINNRYSRNTSRREAFNRAYNTVE